MTDWVWGSGFAAGEEEDSGSSGGFNAAWALSNDDFLGAIEMKKNVASQVVGVQMVATDGSAFTGSVTAYVTGDGGTQATGSVGSGACTHEGNGYHTYVPAQAETNYDQIGFTFTGTGAIPRTLTVYPSFPQTANNATGIADIQSRIPAALVSGRIDASVGAMANNVLTAAAINADAITAAKVAADVTTELQSGLATAADLATVAGYIDTEITTIINDIAAVKLDTAAILVDTAEIGAAGAGLTALAAAAGQATIDSKVDDIKTKTDSLNFTVAGNVDANIQYVNDTAVVGTGASGDEWGS